MKRNLEWNADCQNGQWGTSRDASHGLLLLFIKNADALHFSDQKFELVHKSSKGVFAQRCCELKLGATFRETLPENAETAPGSLDIA